jgi:hypothetical protein
MLCYVKGQLDHKARPRAVVAIEHDATAVGGDDLTHNSQAEARAARAIAAHAALPDPLMHIDRYARPAIGDAQAGDSAPTRNVQAHRAAGRGDPQGIIEQIQQCLLEQVAVAKHADLTRDDTAQGNPGAASATSEQGAQLIGKLAKAHLGAPSQAQQPVVRRAQQVVHQTGQTPGLGI